MIKKRTKLYVVVHRNEDDEVQQVSESFGDENEAGGHAQRLLMHINFFAGDKLCVEDEAGQAGEARNE